VNDQLHAAAALLPGNKATVTHWIGGWVGTRADLDRWWREKFPTRAGSRTPDHPVHSL